MINKFSTLHKAERDYSSVAQFISHLKYLGLSASAEEFKTELKKYRNEIFISYEHLLEANNDIETEIPFYAYVFYGQDSVNKWDFILSVVPVERVQSWLEEKNPTLPSETFHTFVFEHPALREVFEKHNFVFTESGGSGLKRDTFEWNGFNVLNAGFNYRNMERVLQELQPTVEAIKKHGFGKILYNPIVFVSRPMQGQVYNTYQNQYDKISAGAYYSIPKDHIVIKATDWDTESKYNSSFAHELGHRFYYKFLSETQRQRWQQHFKDRQIVITEQKIRDLKKVILSCAPVIKDMEGKEDFPDFSRFNYAQFTHKLRKNPEIKEVVDFIVEFYAEDKSKNIKTKRREYFTKIFNPSEFYNLAWAGKILPLLIKTMETQKLTPAVIQVSKGEKIPVELWSKYKIDELEMPDKETAMYFAKVESRYLTCVSILQHWAGGWNYFVGKTIKLSHSSSKYGENNPQEDDAEAFEYFIHNKEMPVDIYK